MTCANFRIFINLCVLGDALVSRVRANVNFVLSRALAFAVHSGARLPTTPIVTRKHMVSG